MENHLLSRFKLILLFFSILVLLTTFGVPFFSDSKNKIVETKLDILIQDIRNDEFELKIESFPQCSDDCAIYFTLDGSTPDTSSTKYEKVITLRKEDFDNLVVINSIQIKNSEPGEVYTQSFLLVDKEHYALPIFSISIDEQELNDPETGIFVEGRNYDGTIHTANYFQKGEEWRRNARLEVLSPNGQTLANRAIKLGVAGNYTTTYDIKSLKLFMETEADSSDLLFTIPDLFPKNTYEYPNLYKHNSLVLSHGGSDFLSRMNIVRWGVLSEFAEFSGLGPILDSQPVVVYLNGKYYGLMELRENVNRSYISNKYSVKAEAVEIFEKDETEVAQNAGYYDLYQVDLSLPENRKNLESKIDIEAFLKYYAFEIIINNIDWLSNLNNYIVYRVNDEDVDNRVKPLLHDLDVTFGMNNKEFEILDYIFDQHRSDSFIRKIFETEYYRNLLINTIIEILNEAFSTERIDAVFDAKYIQIVKDIRNLEAESHLEYIRFLASKWDGNFFYFKNEIIERRDVVLNKLNDKYNFNKAYLLSIKGVNDNQCIRLNTSLIKQNVNASYYANIPVRLQYLEGCINEFVAWSVNGEMIDSREIWIDEKIVADNEVLNIEVLARNNTSDELEITAVYNDDFFDWIEIRNNRDDYRIIEKLYLSDDLENLKKSAFEDVYFDSKGSIRFHGRSSGSLTKYLLNFNLGKAEYIYLSNDNGIIDKTRVPITNRSQIYRKTDIEGTFEFVNRVFD